MIPTEVKIILKAQFAIINIVLVDQDHKFYANGYNGGSSNMLCYEGPSTKQFVYIGLLKHFSPFNYFSVQVDLNNQLTACGILGIGGVTLNTATKTEIPLPVGELIDVHVNERGANALI